MTKTTGDDAVRDVGDDRITVHDVANTWPLLDRTELPENRSDRLILRVTHNGDNGDDIDPAEAPKDVRKAATRLLEHENYQLILPLCGDVKT